ncbi:MAG TPA: prolipoprotein diacylglyceryl transferase family protein [Polyangiaceae bacterium]|nr:prolipoprotein diacylglyceryl transferase family protein [Polyangiaceae bacterium]
MHPTLFEIPLGPSRVPLFGHVLWLGSLEVAAFGALFAVAVALGGWVTLRLGERAGLGREPLLAVLAAALFAGLLGARLGFVLLHPGLVQSFGDAVSLKSGGLSGTLGLVAGASVAFFAARSRRLSAATLFDAVAPVFGIGVALTRLGCYLEGCDFGRPLSASAPRWLARLGTFPARSHAWVDHVSSGALAPDAQVSLPVHPSELYECILALALTGFSLFVRRRSTRAGDAALAVAAGYLAVRVLVDFSRPASADVWCARSVLLAAGGLATLVTLRARARHP